MLVTRTWYLEVNGIPLATPAWEIPDLATLLDAANVRGRDRVLPGAAGGRRRKRRKTFTTYTLPLDVLGDHDWNGNPIPEADQFEQLNLHMEYLRDNLGSGLEVGDGTVPVIFHRGPLPSWSGDAHVEGPRGSRTEGDVLCRTTIDITVDGELTPGGS